MGSGASTGTELLSVVTQEEITNLSETAQKELEALSKINMWHALTQEPGAERLAAAAAKWVCACNARVRSGQRA